LFSIFLSGIFFFPNSSAPIPSTESELTFDTDTVAILEAITRLQDSMPPPPTEFRAGHVSPRQISDYLEERSEGFVIQLPKGSLTPSPTVYKDVLLVSGGFGSKEYYAFDATTGAVRWAVDLDDDGPTSAVVEEDIAVFNTESCTIFACDVNTGEQLWSYFLGDPLMGTPSIADGIVYTAYPAGNQGQLNNYYQQSINTTPSNIQQQSLQPGSQPNKVAAKSLRLTHVLIALELKTGKILWQRWIDGDVMSAPVVEGEELFVTTFPGSLYKLNAKTGDFLAAQACRATSAPVIVGSDIYMSQRSDDGKSAARENLSTLNKNLNAVSKSYTRDAPYLDQHVQSQSQLKKAAASYDAGNGFTSGAPANSGWQQASYNIGQSNVSSLQAFQGSRVLHHEGRNYATMGDELVCTDPKSGKVHWKKSLSGDLKKEGGFLATPPLMVDDKVMLASLEGDVIIYEAGSGKEWKRFETHDKIRFQPVVQDGRIYVSTVGGKVMCFDTGQKELTGWPTWGANAAHTNKIK